jgi:hypothetical protein
MGADFDFIIVKSVKKTDVKKQFKAYQKEAAHESGHEYSGRLNMCPDLEFHDKTFTKTIDAIEYLTETARKWESAIAVQVDTENGSHIVVGGICSC